MVERWCGIPVMGVRFSPVALFLWIGGRVVIALVSKTKAIIDLMRGFNSLPIRFEGT